MYDVGSVDEFDGSNQVVYQTLDLVFVKLFFVRKVKELLKVGFHIFHHNKDTLFTFVFLCHY